MWQIFQKRQFISLLIEEGDFLPQDVKYLPSAIASITAVRGPSRRVTSCGSIVRTVFTGIITNAIAISIHIVAGTPVPVSIIAISGIGSKGRHTHYEHKCDCSPNHTNFLHYFYLLVLLYFFVLHL